MSVKPVDNLSDDELVERMFLIRFKAWEYPREGAEAVLRSMPSEDRQVYYEKARELTENSVLALEFKECTRRMYTQLALNEGTELERKALRLALVWVSQFGRRLADLKIRIKNPPKVSVASKL